MYRLTLPLLSPETLSSSSKRIFLYNVHLALFVLMDDTVNAYFTGFQPLISTERACAACAEMPAEHVLQFAAILIELFLYSFSSFLLKIH